MGLSGGHWSLPSAVSYLHISNCFAFQTRVAQQQLTELEDRHTELIQLEKSIQELRDIFIEISNLVSTQVTQVAPEVGEKLFWAVAGGQHWAIYLKGVEILTKIGSGSIFYLDPNVMSSLRSKDNLPQTFETKNQGK